MLNKGKHNTVEKKAVVCNIIKELIKRVDELVANCDNDTLEEFEFVKDEYNNVKSGEYRDYEVGSLLNFLGNYEDKLSNDVYIYTCEYYKPDEEVSRYSGLVTLPNGAQVYVMSVYQEEHSGNMCKVLYFDGDQLRLFTPYEGNYVDIDWKVCLCDETWVIDRIMGREVDYDESEELIGEHVAEYVKQYGYECDPEEYDELDIELYWDAICDEIDMILG